jgi:thioesterase domain-containing protein/acyl carrier protein
LRIFLKKELPKYYLPSNIICLERLPLSHNGKVDRTALPEPDSSRPDLDHGFIQPRDAFELKLIQIWEEVLKITPIGVKDDFFELGGHSLLAAQLMARIEKAFNKRLPLSAIFNQPSVEQLAILLREEDAEPQTSLLVCIQPEGTRRPLFFVHPAGGNVLCYYELSRRLGPEQPFYGLQACGLEGDALAPSSIEEMAAHYVNAIMKVQPRGPYFLGGWSLGAIIGFEMAQQFRSMGEAVALLALLDHRPPEQDVGWAPPDDISVLGRVFGDELKIDTKYLKSLGPEERLDYLLGLAQARNLLPPSIEAKQVQSYLDVYKNNVRALHRYEPKVYSGRITLFKTTQEKVEEDSTLGWGALAQAVEVYEAPGRHENMIAEPHVEVLARLLEESIKKAESEVQAGQ